MNWFSLVMMILSVIRALRKSQTKAEFLATSAGAKAEAQLGGDWIEKIWQNREEILEFVLKLISMLSQSEEDEQIALSSIED